MKSRRKHSGVRTAVQLAELGVAAPQVIAHRLARMALAGPAISARDRKEFTGMVVEKQVAAAQAWLGVMTEAVRFQQQFALSLWTAATPRQHAARVEQALSRMTGAAVAPMHRKAVSNAKRLARTKLR